MRVYAVAVCVLALALLNFFQFPGHTYLQSDTQIYAPILEHLWDPSVLARDLIVERPHVAYTLYDEAASAVRKLTGLDLERALQAQQLVCRALGIWGLYLLASAFGLSVPSAWVVTAIVSLGATIVGPAVLTFEYEPVPRGFAVALTFLALGLAAQGRLLVAGLAAAAATLYHAPTAVPFWAVFLWMAWRKPEGRVRAVLPLAGAAAAIVVAAHFQSGPRPTQVFFSQVAPELEKLQRLRASYNWISIWAASSLPHHLILWVIGLLAGWRLRWPHRWLTIGLPLIGVLSVPLSYVLLEQAKWALMPQVQPMRALLFVTLLTTLLAAVAGARAAHWLESAAWFAVAYLIPLHIKITNPLPLGRAALLAGLAGLAVVATRERPWSRPLAAIAAAVPFFAIPMVGRIRNYPDLHSSELRELAEWARRSTPRKSVFLFPNFGQAMDPGIFRAYSLRAVYVDWKGGGQANHSRGLAEEWWKRWNLTMVRPFDPLRVPNYGAVGIDYFAVRPKDRLPAAWQAVYENGRYAVYAAREP